MQKKKKNFNLNFRFFFNNVSALSFSADQMPVRDCIRLDSSARHAAQRVAACLNAL